MLTPSTQSAQLRVKTVIESEYLSCASVHNIWGMVQLEGGSQICQNLPIDFIVVIDQSASMKVENKLVCVKASIEYMVSQLNVNHRFCLIGLNQKIRDVTNGLQIINKVNKESIVNQLKAIEAEGSTNISDGLLTAFQIVKSREDQTRLPTIFLFTDGLSNVGLQGDQLMARLKQEYNLLPKGLTIHTFGYGQDHDSAMLREMCFSFPSSVYYYIEDSDNIPSIFGECLSGLLSMVAQDINIRIIAKDGCRIVGLYTPMTITENQSAKDYSIAMGHLYSLESRTLLFKLSVRQMQPDCNQDLYKVQVEYKNTSSGNLEMIERVMSINRSPVVIKDPIPIELDQQINRFSTVMTIENAITECLEFNFCSAQQKINNIIQCIVTSSSASKCGHLIIDLLDCSRALHSNRNRKGGLHYARAYSLMYWIERSTGTSYLIGLNQFNPVKYSYTTTCQQSGATKALEYVKKYW